MTSENSSTARTFSLSRGDKHCPDVPSLVFGCDGWGRVFLWRRIA